MATAVYAISHKDTFSILAVCSLQKQPVSDAKTASALLDRLVGGKMTLSIPTAHAGPISIPASVLIIDEVNIDANTLALNPYGYQIAPTGTQKPGDGTPKGVSAFSNPTTISLAANGTLTVKPVNPPGPPIPMYAILEGHQPQSLTLQVPNDHVDFAFTDTLISKTAYGVVFVGLGVPTLVGTLATP